MKMSAFRINNREGEGQCEECAETTPYQNLYGVVAISDIERADINLTKRATAEYLLWEKGIGQILCMDCINKKAKKRNVLQK